MSALEDSARAFRAALLANDAEAARRLVTAYMAIHARIRDQLDLLLAEIDAARARGESVSLSWLYRSARYQQLLRDAEAEVGRFARLAGDAIRRQQSSGVDLAQGYARQLILDGLGPGPEAARAQVAALLMPRLPRANVAALVGFLSDGSPLADLLDELGPQAARGIRQALTVGVGTGLSPRETARLVRKASGMVLDRALVIARQETLRAARTATQQTFAQNRDVLEGWVWHAQLGSPRTCPLCIAMHGTLHPIDEPFASHIACRCTPVPRTKSWADLLGPAFAGIPDRRAAIEPGIDWFGRQRAAFQQRVLGPGKYAAFAAGQITLPDLVGVKHSRKWGRTLVERPLRDLVPDEGVREAAN